MRIFLDGTEFSEKSSLDDLQITYTEDTETKTVNRKIGENITLVGDAYDYLNGVFFSDCNGYKQTVSVEIEPDCCSKSYAFNLTYEGVKKDAQKCEIDITPADSTDELTCFRDLNETIFWKNGFDALEHPRIEYCNQSPGFMIIAMLALRMNAIVALVIVSLSINPAIAAAIAAFTALGIREILDPAITGCKKYHAAPLINKIIDWNVNRCGLQFKSSILNQAPYNRAGLLMAQYVDGKGNKRGPIDTGKYKSAWTDDNAANLTTIQLLELLKPVFNADYRIIDGTLFFERVDFFDTYGIQEIDLSEETEYEIQFDDNTASAYGRYEYTSDALDQEAQKIAPFVNDIIEWNDPPSDWQKGEKTNIVRFSGARFVLDEYSNKQADKGSIIGGAAWEADKFRNRKGFFTAGFRGLGPKRSATANQALILTSDLSSEFKLIVLEEGYSTALGSISKPMRRKINSRGGLSLYQYNWPMSFSETEPEGLYEQFHKISDPRLNNFSYYKIPKIEILLNCNDLDKIEEHGTHLNLVTPVGTGKAEQIKVNFGTGLITFENIRVKCS